RQHRDPRENQSGRSYASCTPVHCNVTLLRSLAIRTQAREFKPASSKGRIQGCPGLTPGVIFYAAASRLDPDCFPLIMPCLARETISLPCPEPTASAIKTIPVAGEGR